MWSVLSCNVNVNVSTTHISRGSTQEPIHQHSFVNSNAAAAAWALAIVQDLRNQGEVSRRGCQLATNWAKTWWPVQCWAMTRDITDLTIPGSAQHYCEDLVCGLLNSIMRMISWYIWYLLFSSSIYVAFIVWCLHVELKIVLISKKFRTWTLSLWNIWIYVMKIRICKSSAVTGQSS